MINRVVLVGRMTKDPELRYTPNGVAVATFTLAVNRPFSNQQGEREADFIAIVVWRRAAENVANFCKKGSLVGVDGRLQTRSYDNNEGKRVYVTEVVSDSVQFLEPKGNGGQPSNNPQTYPQQGQQNQRQNSRPQQSGPQNPFNDPFANDGPPINISDDDLPF
ncbi:MAG TPA: single-stranded DNA-binding protein [Sporolactobacillaceae bacterium]|nr:single-stranded DNA-binding protein [Sporolactobacillaceae bacterium]